MIFTKGKSGWTVYIHLTLLCSLLLASCGASDSSVAGTDQRLQEYLFAPDSELPFRQAELVTKCARANGLSGYTELAFDPNSELEVTDPVGSLGGEREGVLAFGTGRIELERVREEQRLSTNELGTPPHPDDELDDTERAILEDGPVLDPESGKTVPLGCRAWAYGTVTADVDVVEHQSLNERYAQWLQDNFFESVEYQAIQRTQFECVAEGGFSGLHSQHDLNTYLAEIIADWRTSKITYEEALELDKAVGLVYYDCYESVRGAFDDLADMVSSQFVEQEGILLD